MRPFKNEFIGIPISGWDRRLWVLYAKNAGPRESDWPGSYSSSPRNRYPTPTSVNK